MNVRSLCFGILLYLGSFETATEATSGEVRRRSWGFRAGVQFFGYLDFCFFLVPDRALVLTDPWNHLVRRPALITMYSRSGCSVPAWAALGVWRITHG